MKLILTENQINFIYEDALARCLQESLNESINFKDLQMKVKKALVAGVAVTTIISAISKLGISDAEKSALTDMVNNTEMTHSTDSLYQKKVDACREYMEWAMNNQGFSLESTGLKPETLVAAAENANISLSFIMAVANQESCFGATRLARETGSVFSQGLWSDGTIHYDDEDKDPNNSVERFKNLIHKNYLVNGKTEQDLLKPGCFVDFRGNRYAKDPKYESRIKSIQNRIIRMYPELA